MHKDYMTSHQSHTNCYLENEQGFYCEIIIPQTREQLVERQERLLAAKQAEESRQSDKIIADIESELGKINPAIKKIDKDINKELKK